MVMEKIPSFTVNHLTLMPGVYISRVDEVGDECITTFDVRMTAPNRTPSLSVGALHAMEHLAATLLRNHPTWKDRVIYWGPMGCCTGNYLLLKGRLTPQEIIPLLTEIFTAISEWDDVVPGATPRDCGNYLLMNLPEARMAARDFLNVLTDERCPTAYIS